MIKPQSVQGKYTLVYSGDPALSLPEDAEAKAHALKVARETGEWDAIVHPGQVPTLFIVKPLTGSAFDYYVGEVNRKELVELEAVTLALRIALLDVQNFGAHKVRRIPVKDYDQSIATTTIIDAIYDEAGEHGRRIIAELGNVIVTRATEALSPL